MNRPDIVASRLKHARKARDLTQRDLAELVPCSVQAIKSIELQRYGLTVNMAVKIGEILHVRPTWLLDLEE